MKKIIVILILSLNIFGYCNAKDIRIAARVNDEIITNIDLESRLLMAMELSNIPDNPDIKNRLKDQVLKVLIEESLKIQEANKLGIFITSDELETAIQNLESRLGFKKNTLVKEYASKNIPEITIYNQVRAQLLWQKMLNILVIKTINVSEEQSSEAFDLFLKNSGETEYNYSEIFVSFSNSNDTFTATERINSIYSQTNINNFLLLAQQFSDGAIIYQNNNNWIRESMLKNELRLPISMLKVGEISKPVKSSAGYHIFLLNDKRTTKKINENETTYDFSQIFFKLSENNKDEQILYYKEFLNNIRDIVKGCEDLDKIINELDEGYGGRFGILNEESIDEKFLQVLSDLSTGQLSKEIISKDGIHSLMLCRPIQKDTFNSIKANIETRIRINKINNAGTLLLNRIKQKSLIEILDVRV
tara:strand:- start:249 stop:1502 length:1254 start_codon:yes stop_codon:yes gene_type:complete